MKRIYGADDLRGSTDEAAHRASLRDAEDRAEQLTDPIAARKLLQRAERSGDATLARAVAARAVTWGWKDIVADYASRHPAWGDAVDNAGDTRLSLGVIANLLFGLRVPDEIKRLTGPQVEEIVKNNAELYRRVGDPDAVLAEVERDRARADTQPGAVMG